MSLQSSVLIGTIIQFPTSDNAFLQFWSVHSISVISSCTLVWPYMESNEIFLGQSGKVDFASFLPTKQQKKTQNKNENAISAATKKAKLCFEIISWNYLISYFMTAPLKTTFQSWSVVLRIKFVLLQVQVDCFGSLRLFFCCPWSESLDI